MIEIVVRNNSSAISVSHWKRYLSRLPMVQGSKCRNEKWEICNHISKKIWWDSKAYLNGGGAIILSSLDIVIICMVKLYQYLSMFFFYIQALKEASVGHTHSLLTLNPINP